MKPTLDRTEPDERLCGIVKVVAHAGVRIVKAKVERLETLGDEGSTSIRGGVLGITD